MSLCQVAVEVTWLPSLDSVAVDAEDTVGSTSSWLWWENVFVSLRHIVRCLLCVPIYRLLLDHHSLLSRRWRNIFLLVLSLGSGRLAIAGWTWHRGWLWGARLAELGLRCAWVAVLRTWGYWCCWLSVRIIHHHVQRLLLYLSLSLSVWI